jgi:hypothetical protein
MTNVAEDREQIRAMIMYKQFQSKNNQESILTALDEVDKPVSSTEIKQHLDQKAFNKTKSKAEDEKIVRQ